MKKNASACPMCMRWLFGPNNSWSKDMAQAGPEYTIPKKQYIANSQSIPYPLKIEIVQLRFIAGGCANPHPALRPVASKVVLPPKIATWAGLPARLPWSRDFFLAQQTFPTCKIEPFHRSMDWLKICRKLWVWIFFLNSFYGVPVDNDFPLPFFSHWTQRLEDECASCPPGMRYQAHGFWVGDRSQLLTTTNKQLPPASNVRNSFQVRLPSWHIRHIPFPMRFKLSL